MNLRESLALVLRAEEQSLATWFYDTFFKECPEAQIYFEGVNLRHQAAVLTMALQVIVEYHEHGYRAMRHYLQVLGHKHLARRIPKSLYLKFRTSLLMALAGHHGNRWTDELEVLWTAAIDRAIDTMFTGYVEGPLYY